MRSKYGSDAVCRPEFGCMDGGRGETSKGHVSGNASTSNQLGGDNYCLQLTEERAIKIVQEIVKEAKQEMEEHMKNGLARKKG